MNDRPDSQDVAKGFMIFLAVMMHVVTAREAPAWRVAISAFHAPLFFIVSGLVIGRAKDGWRPYVRKNALLLLLPYLIWSLIFMPFRLEAIPWVLYGNWMGLNRIGANTALWFLPALFCARLMYEAVMQVIERLHVPRLPAVIVSAAVSFVFGWLLPRPDIGYPFGLQVGVIALGFILIGSVIRECLTAAERQDRAALLIAFLVVAALFAYGAFLRPGEHDLVGMAEFSFGNRFWFFWNALLGCAAVLALSAMLAKAPEGESVLGRVRQSMVWLGGNALGVLLTHVPVCRFLVSPCLQACGIDRLAWYGAFAIAVATTAICCGLIYVTGKFLPALLVWLGIRRGVL